MNLTKKISLSFGSDIIITVFGFLGTIYFARELGSEPIGTYALFTTVLSWFIVIDLGVNQAATKQISGGTDRSEYVSTFVVIHFVQLVVSIIVIIFFRERIIKYIGGSFVTVIVVLLLTKHIYQITGGVLKGLKQVHVVDSTDAIDQVTQVAAQAGLVFIGYRGISLIYGHLLGVIISTLFLFIYFILNTKIELSLPSQKHIKSMYNYMRFSWLSSFNTQAVSKVDITILGFFVANSAIGAYSVAWTMAMSLQIFGSAIARNVFPEISNLDKINNTQRIQNIISETLLFAGIFPIPGAVGVLILDEELLSIYGSDFLQATTVLPILASVALIRSFNKPIKSFLNGINRPDINFWTDIIFIYINILLNIVLIIEFGIVGAGIATLISMKISLLIRWIILSSIVSVSFPAVELGKQVISALGMGLMILIAEQLIVPSTLLSVVILVAFGACIYFAFLFSLSQTIRFKFLRVIRSSN